MITKKKIFILLFLPLLFIGCTSKKTNEHIENLQVFASTDKAIDYSFKIDLNAWDLIEDKTNNEIELIKFQQKDYELLFMKNTDISTESHKKNQVREIPNLMLNTLRKANIEPTNLIVDESYNDYVGDQVYLHTIGTYQNKYYQALFFETSHFLPSVSGKIVPNCIICFYDNSKDKKIITQELTNLQNQMIFE